MNMTNAGWWTQKTRPGRLFPPSNLEVAIAIGIAGAAGAVGWLVVQRIRAARAASGDASPDLARLEDEQEQEPPSLSPESVGVRPPGRPSFHVDPSVT